MEIILVSFFDFNSVVTRSDMMNKDIFYMQKAVTLAEKAETLGEVPVGAIAVVGDEVIGKGFNQPICSSDPSAHAEIIALREAASYINNYRLLEVVLYVTLEPCMMCIGTMLHARIKRLVFGAADPKTGAVVSVFRALDEKNLNHKIEFTGGVLAEECGKLLKNFFRKRR